MRKGRRWLTLLLILALLWGAAWFVFWQNCMLQPEEVELVFPELPPEFDGLRVAEAVLAAKGLIQTESGEG